MLGYITRPSSLKSLCLTSKCLSSVATPLLYKKLTLDANEPDSKTSTAFVNASSRHGLVKHLICNPELDSISDQSIALDLVKRVLGVLPSHRLREFSLPSDLALNGPLMMQIATNQQNLEGVDWPIVFTHL